MPRPHRERSSLDYLRETGQMPAGEPAPSAEPVRDEWPEDRRGDEYGSRAERNGPAPQARQTANREAEEKEKPSWPAPIPASLLRLKTGQPWLWDGYIAPGCITLLSSLWKAGKTTMLAHLLKAFEEGGEFCGRRVQASRVLYVSEESEHRWAKRRDQLMLSDNVSFIVRPFRGRADWSAWSDFTLYVAEWVRANPVNLVVFDPLVNLWPVRDENDNGQVLSALLPLYNVAEVSSLLLLHHVRKGDGNEGTASRGAGALTGFVDTIVELRRYCPGETKDRRRVLTGYGRDDETPDELVIELSDQGYRAHGDRGEVSLMDLLPTIAGILPHEAPGWTRNEVYDNWPEGKGKPNTNRLLEALHRGADNDSWQRNGGGVRGSPWRFYRPSR